MKYVYACLAVAMLCLFSSLTAWADESCECPKLACDPCSFEKGVTFFTAKCGPSNSKLKSCGRPTCIALDQASEHCPHPPAADSGPREPVVVKSVHKESAEGENSVSAVGRVKVISGSVTIVRADGQKVPVTSESDVHESDRIESGSDGSALVNFAGGNKLHVQHDTAVVVKEYKDQKIEESRRTLLHLIKGKIRSQVEQKYNGKSSYYRISTKAATAGVRGTDFLMEYSEEGRSETKIETFGGKVMLASLDEKQAVDIVRGEGATFTADLPDSSFGDRDLSEFLKRGTLSPVYKIPEEKFKQLDQSSRVDLAKAKKAPVETAICQKPKGLFNQCLWKFDDKGVCVRLRCNANGEWSDSTHVTADRADSCPEKGERVRDCDY